MKGKRLLMIPGPIEFTDEVLAEMSLPTLSHVDPLFIEEFGQAIEKMRKVWLAPNGQPFAVAGSGTLAMELAAANITEPGDNVLIVHTGYFSDRMADIFRLHGANVDIVPSTVGDLPSLELVRTQLKAKHYKTLSITHVDTSTGVRADVRSLAAAAHETSTLVVVDGVCAVAGEELRMEEWGWTSPSLHRRKQSAYRQDLRSLSQVHEPSMCSRHAKARCDPTTATGNTGFLSWRPMKREKPLTSEPRL